MTPPGWRTPLVDAPRADEPAQGPAEVSAPLPTRGLSALTGPLWPGLHLVVGSYGSGRTQFVLQTAIDAALLGIRSRAFLPDLSRREAALRIAAAVSGLPWAELARSPDHEVEAHLDRVGGAPFSVDALSEGSLAAPAELSSWPSLLVSDARSTGSALVELRQKALLCGAVAVAVGRSGHHRPTDSDKTPTQHLAALSVAPDDIEASDSVWVLLPSPEQPGHLRVGLAKSTRAVPGWASVSFRGARFEDLDRPVDAGESLPPL